MLEKLFSRGSPGKHCVRSKFSLMDEVFGRNLFLSDRIVESRFCDFEDECLRDRRRYVSIRYVLHSEHVAFVFYTDPLLSF